MGRYLTEAIWIEMRAKKSRGEEMWARHGEQIHHFSITGQKLNRTTIRICANSDILYNTARQITSIKTNKCHGDDHKSLTPILKVELIES